MKILARFLTCVGLFVVIYAGLAGSSCPPCNLPNKRIDSAAVIITHITAPPGGGSQRFLEVRASGFHPNAQGRISIPSMPAPGGSSENILENITFDSQGSLYWRRDQIPFIIPPADPNLDIFVTVSEADGGCFASRSFKQNELMKLF